MLRSSSRRYARSSYSPYREPAALGIRAGALLIVGAALLVGAGPLGYRVGWLSMATAVGPVFDWAARLAGVGVVLALLGLLVTFRRRRDARHGIGRAILTMAVGGAVLWVTGRLPLTAPPPALTDVSTDTNNPPAYVTVAQIRGDESGAMLAYPGEPHAAHQRAVYPDIQPLQLTMSTDEAFRRALSAVRDLGWTLVSADGGLGRIEASATTRLFGTVDDVVVRISPEGSGSRVDARSTSRQPGGTMAATHVRALLLRIGR